MTPVFKGIVENGKLKLEDPLAFGNWLKGLIGKKVFITVKKATRPRTTGKEDELGNQNGYYWSVVLPICASELGYTVKEMHEVFINEYSPYIIREFKGKKINIRVRTSDMNTVQFAEFLNTIIIEMAQMNIQIPEPQKIC